MRERKIKIQIFHHIIITNLPLYCPKSREIMPGPARRAPHARRPLEQRGELPPSDVRLVAHAGGLRVAHGDLQPPLVVRQRGVAQVVGDPLALLPYRFIFLARPSARSPFPDVF